MNFWRAVGGSTCVPSVPTCSVQMRILKIVQKTVPRETNQRTKIQTASSQTSTATAVPKKQSWPIISMRARAAGQTGRHEEMRKSSTNEVAGDKERKLPRVNRNRPLSQHRYVEKCATGCSYKLVPDPQACRLSGGVRNGRHGSHPSST
jgi:hypothetical protein